MNTPRRTALTTLLMAAICSALLSCTRGEDWNGPQSRTERRSLENLKQSLPETICVYDPAEYFPVGSRGGSGEPVSVSSRNLDYGHASFLSVGEYDYIQIPVRASTPLSRATVRFHRFTDGSDGAWAADSRAYLITQTARDSVSDSRISLVTIIPHPNHMREGELDSLDFFYKGYFNAVFLYSDLDGRITKVETYVRGIPYRLGCISGIPADSSALVSVVPEEKDVSQDTLASPVRLSEWLNAIYVVADGPDNSDDGWDDDGGVQYPWLGETQWPNEGGGSGHGGGNDGNDDEAALTTTVRIHVVDRGIITGTGTYRFGQVISCTASPLYYGDTQTSEFVGWSGHINSSSPTITFVLQPTFLSREVSLTATFHNYSPCATGEKRDPLLEMEILGSSGSGITGGRFGKDVRKDKYGNPKEHSGIDLSCPVGTPVFATISGKVVAIRTEFKNGETWDEYQNRGGKAAKPTFSAGNSVYIQGTINGRTYTTVFWHLTDVFVEVRDVVEVGSIIGTSGRTGNASHVGCAGPHLHYQVQDSNWERVDPEEFIHTVFDSAGKQTNPCY